MMGKTKMSLPEFARWAGWELYPWQELFLQKFESIPLDEQKRIIMGWDLAKKRDRTAARFDANEHRMIELSTGEPKGGRKPK